MSNILLACYENAHGKCKRLFYSMSEEDKDGEPIPNGGEDYYEGIDPGVRAPGWYERIEAEVKENSKQARRNEKRLVRLDYRTVWILRLLAAMVTILGGKEFAGLLGIGL
jgi:hypothetical protein